MAEAEKMRRIAVVGASLAGTRAAEALRRRGFDGELTLIGAEPVPAYQRPALSKRYLLGDADAEDIALPSPRDDMGIRLRLATRAVRLDLAERRLWLASGRRAEPEPLPYDGLVIACGTTARTLPGKLPEGVHTLRTEADARALRADLRRGTPRVAVVGGGLVGQEVAATARKLGHEVTLIDPLPAPGVRALGLPVARMLAALHAEHGTRLRLGVGVAAVEGEPRITGVRLTDGSVVVADVVVVAIGVLPATQWLEGSGLTLENGLCCSPNLAVLGAGSITAAGDVARWHDPGSGRSLRVEHWENALRQAEVAARTLLEGPDAPAFDEVPMFWTSLYGLGLQVLGHPGQEDTLHVVEGDLAARRCIAVYRDGSRVTGVVLVNAPHRLRDYRAALRNGTPQPAA
ncbi:FAD/NAD(P)-binding oxidoreductase [Streptomyces sp. DSM 44917]|uniref:FAD/NAD(P)-binding oxidoreductase n=1 Tax=Streptomyces boetiae TaxID=3075541 RepID=A0ABU2L7R5_9ACTN|nr:FAD/NAD(P)-binding oxidoreductase [Streptomyces sp. DSM 44917]MDT0307545.1 FAD/NAD(P)-binding oxidoreductase [Streptomyces sp. DSM 44917]